MDNNIVSYSERNFNKKKDNEGINLKNKKLKYIIISSILFFIVLAIIIIIVIVCRKKTEEPPITPPKEPEITIPLDNPSIPLITKKKLEYEQGFTFKTEIGQLNRIIVKQHYDETTIRNGKQTKISFDRKDIYDIYVISESEPIGELKYCYSKLYTCAVSIVAECESMRNNNCNPSTILDLVSESIPNETEARNLQEIEDIEDIPIPLCLFNITDNNGITSIKCPKSMDEGKVKGIVLDLYFFRPPGIKRVNKKENNITIDIVDLEDGNKLVRETNGGRCAESNLISFCSTNMNTTKDAEGNLISYQEIATTNITKDENNMYIKIKETILDDITEKNNNSTAEIYKGNMEKLLEKLNPFMHYYEQVSEEQFIEIYKLSINGELPKKKKTNRKGRGLDEEKKGYIKEEEIFTYDDLGGTNIFLTLSIDSSLNSDTFKANSYLKFGEDEEDELVNNKYQSILTEIFKKISILSQAGNHLVNILYQNIKNPMQDITQVIKKKIEELNNLVVYENITKIFDTSIQLEDFENLPYQIVGESNILYDKINSLLTELNTPITKKKFEIINKNIFDFLTESFKIINKISYNLKELGNLVNSEGNQLTQISLHYLNKKSSSYMDIIEKVEKILNNYYKNEKDLINSNINSIIENFEEHLSQSSKSESDMLTKLCKKLDNKTIFIENSTDNSLQETINYLSNTTLLINNIKDKIKYLINNEVELKGEYFRSEYDIKKNNISFSGRLNKAKQIADNDELIDEVFDEKMGYFRNNFSDNLIEIRKEIEEQFYLEEEVLQSNLFKDKNNEITQKFNNFGINAIKEIIKENDEYQKKINTTITNFLNENEELLYSLIYDLYIFVSNESLIELADLYDIAFNSSLNTTSNIIDDNEILAQEFFNDIKGVIENSTYILEKIKDFNDNKLPTHLNIWSDTHYDTLQYINQTIVARKITKAYISKYIEYKANIEYSKEYINNQLNLDLINSYKKQIFKLGKILQLIKNNKLDIKYPKYSKIGFNSHKQIINKLFNRIDSYLSDDIYNNKYKKLYNEYKSLEKTKIETIEKYIENQNNAISNNSIVDDELEGDYCIRFIRKGSYLSTSKIWFYKTYSNDYCLPVSKNTNNHLKLKEATINYDNNLIEFNKKFDEFYDSINEKVEKYISKIDKIKSDLQDIENEITNKKIILNYISTFKEELNQIFEKKYGNELIKNSYNYFKDKTTNKIDKVLNVTKNKWNKTFKALETELSENTFKFSNEGFLNMALIYYSIITQNITNDYYESIIINQKNEFNYTISYYYNYLLRLANSTHNYIMNKIISNQNYYNYIVEQRKNIIDEFFNSLIEKITLEEKEALNFENQLNILGVEESDFFQVKNILDKNIEDTNDSLMDIISNLNNLINDIRISQNPIIANMYLENLKSKKEIETLYNPIYDNNFIILNEEKFKEIIINNQWVFNFDEFNNEIEVKLYNLNKEINDELSIHKENYIQQLEGLINKFFTKEEIIEKVNELYNEGIKKMDNNIKNDIMQNIDEILDKIIDHLKNESIRIRETTNLFNNNTSKINNTLEDFKKEIFDKLNETLFFVVNEFNQKLNNKFLDNYVNKCLNNFDEQIIIDESIPQVYNLLNSSLYFREIINNIKNELKKEYKTITQKQINYKYKKKIKEIYSLINLEEIKYLIDKKIDFEYENFLLPTINEMAQNDLGYNEYDFDISIQNDIEKVLNQKIENIKKLINSTKGHNYQIDIKNWVSNENLDFSEYSNIVNLDINRDFESFYLLQKENEEKRFNDSLKEVIKNNFNNLLSYLIPTFGKKYFERIIKYNENFKIESLYNNLRYSISETLAYYIMETNEINNIPLDLKRKIYILNDLDSTVENKNIEILSKINYKLDEFINNIQIFIIKQYIDNYNNEFSVESNYNQNILSIIKSNLSDLYISIKKKCSNDLNEYLKEPFIESYKKVMNEKTEEMVIFTKEKKNIIRDIILYIKTTDTDNILETLNETINKIEESVNEYNNHFKTFEIDNELLRYLNEYGNINLHPLFLNLINTINSAKINNKNININYLNENLKKYEDSFKLNEFINLSNDIKLFFNENYFKKITEYIEDYNPNNYKNKLEEEQMKYKDRYIRRLEGKETREDIENKFRDRIADKALDTTFQNILNSSEMVKTFINGLNEFEVFNENINKYINFINENYKKSEKIIKDKKEKDIFDDDLYKIFNEKLMYLQNITQNYYTQISESYSYIRNFLNESIINIDINLIYCANVTYSVFNNELYKIKNEIIPDPIQANYSYNSINNNLIDY